MLLCKIQQALEETYYSGTDPGFPVGEGEQPVGGGGGGGINIRFCQIFQKKKKKNCMKFRKFWVPLRSTTAAID